MASANGRLLLPVRIFIVTPPPLVARSLPRRHRETKNRHPEMDQGAKKRAECNSGMTGWQWLWESRQDRANKLILLGFQPAMRYRTTSSSGRLDSVSQPVSVTSTVWPLVIANPASLSKMIRWMK